MEPHRDVLGPDALTRALSAVFSGDTSRAFHAAVDLRRADPATEGLLGVLLQCIGSPDERAARKSLRAAVELFPEDDLVMAAMRAQLDDFRSPLHHEALVLIPELWERAPELSAYMTDALSTPGEGYARSSLLWALWRLPYLSRSQARLVGLHLDRDSWLVRSAALAVLASHPSLSEDVALNVKELSVSDPNADVRRMALHVLENWRVANDARRTDELWHR